jgi:Fe-S cluster assembly iron-binding protein IscA
MLQVSENAVAALENIRSTEGVPESYGVRVSGGQEAGGDIVISLAFVETPAEADQVTEQAGTEIYVAPEVAEPLSAAVMDVHDSDDGLQLVIRPQRNEA